MFFSKQKGVYIEGLQRSDVIVGGMKISCRALLATYIFSKYYFMLFGTPIPKDKAHMKTKNFFPAIFWTSKM